METIYYKGYSIVEDYRNPYSNKPEYMFYPTEDGVQHDADYDDGWRYTGNCKWADSIEEAKDEISEKVFLANYPQQWYVQHSEVLSPAPWDFLEDAMKFAVKLNAIPMFNFSNP